LAFGDVTIWHDPSSAQSFVLNTGLFRRTYQVLQRSHQPGSERPWTTLISLDDPPTLLPRVPVNIMKVLEDVHTRTLNNTTSIICSQELTPEVMIPIAAILLEYPVGYMPTSSNQTAFLSGEPLDVYVCHLLVHGGIQLQHPHTLLKFSCPCAIGIEHTKLSPEQLIDRMKGRFIPRLKKAADSITMDILVSIERHDRVAL